MSSYNQQAKLRPIRTSAVHHRQLGADPACALLGCNTEEVSIAINFLLQSVTDMRLGYVTVLRTGSLPGMGRKGSGESYLLLQITPS